MTILDLQKVISSATTITICFAKSKRDADNEKAYARYFVDVYSRVEGLDEREVYYIYPRAKDDLDVWCVG